jgi:hypothetical protein
MAESGDATITRVGVGRSVMMMMVVMMVMMVYSMRSHAANLSHSMWEKARYSVTQYLA